MAIQNLLPLELAISYQGPYGVDYGANVNQTWRQALDEVEIRELLIDHVGHRCCWGSRPARMWKIHSVEDCNVYVGTLDTFIEEREIITERPPHAGGSIDGRDSGPELGVWELDLRDQFPVLFVPQKETRMKVPHSEVLEKCSGCEGRGNVLCSTCNANQEPGYYKENQMSPCPACHGRGLIAHRDGSDTIGKGKFPCATCGSRGLIKCEMCRGNGSFWHAILLLSNGKHYQPERCAPRAEQPQAYQCTPAFFADSYFLNNFSSEVIAGRANVPPTARVICERHTIYVVPVTQVTMSHHRGRSLSFYIVGLTRTTTLLAFAGGSACASSG